MVPLSRINEKITKPSNEKCLDIGTDKLKSEPISFELNPAVTKNSGSMDKL